MTDLIPVRFKELFSLQKAGISLSDFKREFVRMESDKCIVVREKKNNIAIINVVNPNVVERVPFSVEILSVIMHPTRRILAFETIGNRLQIFDLDKNVQIKAFTVKKAVDFWTWINSNTIGFVTKTSIYHWALDDDSEPTNVYFRFSSLKSKTITDYQSNADGRFLLLVGVEKTKYGRTDGSMQLFGKGKSIGQSIEAHAGCFVQFKMEGSPDPINLLCYFLHKPGKGKLTIKELKTPTRNKQYTKKSVDFEYYNVPLSIQASSAYGILYMITDYGYVHVFEIETCCSIYRVSILFYSIFITTEHTCNGFLAISDCGKVFSVCLDEANIIPYVTQKLQNPDLARKLSSRLKLALESKDDASGKPIPMPWKTESSSKEDKNVGELVESASINRIPTTSRIEISCGEEKNISEVVESASRCKISDVDDVVRKFDLLIKNGDYHEAAKLAATAPKNILRTPQTLQKLTEASPPAKATHSLVIYFTTLLEQGPLNKYESLELCRPVLVQGKKQLVEKWISESKLECSEELGDLVKQYDVDLATSIYLRGNVSYKVYRSLGDVLREHSPTR